MSLKPYPKYKDSGVEWLGNVPEHWDVKPLKFVVTINDEALPETTDDDFEMQYVDIGSVSLNKGIESVEEFNFKTAPSRARRIVRHGDVIVSTVRTYLKAIAPISLPPSNLIVSTGFAVIRSNKIMQPAFAKFTLQSSEFVEDVIARSTGVSYPAINATELGRIKFCLPLADEQTAIANFLDHETSKIDALIAEQEKLASLLVEKLHSLVLSSFSNDDTVHIRLLNAVDIVARPVRQDEHTTYEPLGLYNKGRGLFHKDFRQMCEMGESDFYWIESGDLIISGQFAWEGAVAMAYEEEAHCVVSHRYPVVRGKNNVALTEYVFALLTTKHGDFLLNQCSIGAAGRNRPLNLSLLLKEKIPVPNMQIQTQIASLVHERRAIDKQQVALIASLNERRTALISAAVTGKIDVRGFSAPLSQ